MARVSKAKATTKAVKACSAATKATIRKAPSASSGIGKGTLTLSSSVKQELYNETTKNGAPQKGDDEWIAVGSMVFYIEIQKRGYGSEKDLVLELKSHAGKHLPMKPHDDSCNPMAIRVGVPGRRHTTIWKYGGDAFLNRFLYYYRDSSRTRCEASIPDNVKVLDDPKRKTWWLVPVDVHFSLHKDIDIMSHPDSNVKRQVKQLAKYLRGGTQPNPPRYAWPIVRQDVADECLQNASILDRLMKKRTAKDWWKKGDAK